LGEGGAFDEPSALDLIAEYGVPVVEHLEAGDVDAALAAAERIGWPVALKTTMPGLTHKSDLGGVHLGLGHPDALRAAYTDLSTRLGPRVTVAAMADPGIDVHLGRVHG